MPVYSTLPQHIAVVMDGNGRWAKQRHLPRFMGHKRGVKATMRLVRACGDYDIPYLTLFAFSTENWQRPQEEVQQLMGLMMNGLEKEVPKLEKKGVKIRFIGNLRRFDQKMVDALIEAEEKTVHNTKMVLSICVDYGGRWDIVQAANNALRFKQQNKEPLMLTEQDLSQHLAMHDMPDPDLFIRTSGEQRVSNFLLWQMAYSELYFSSTLWPDFSKTDLDDALDSFAKRDRRFGKTSPN